MSEVTDTAESPAVGSGAVESTAGSSPTAASPAAASTAAAESPVTLEAHSPDHPGALIDTTGPNSTSRSFPRPTGRPGGYLQTADHPRGDHPGPRLHQHRLDHLRRHLHRRRRRHPALSRVPDRAARQVIELHRDQLPADPRGAADLRRTGRVHPADQPARHVARGPEAILRRLPAGRAPDAGVVSAVSALSTFYQDSLDPFNPEQVELSTIRLLAKLPTIAAYAYKKSVGQPLLYPDNSLGLVENFLRMSFGFPAEPYEVNPELVHALDQLLILHADHEQNCSTSTVRLDRLVERQPVRVDLGGPSTRCSARCTAARTRRCWRCWRGSGGTATTSPPSSGGSRTRSPASS